MMTIGTLYLIAAALALAGHEPTTAPNVTQAIGFLAALPAIASGVSAIGGLIQGGKRQRNADRYNRQAIDLARQDYEGRSGFRDRAKEELLGEQPQAPGFERVEGGTVTDYAPARQEIDSARIPGMSGPARTAQRYQLGALNDVYGGMDRGEIASMRFQNLLDQAGEARKLGTERIGQDAARLGRIGMGGVATSLGDLEERIQTGITRQGRDLAAWAAEGDIGDRFNRLGAVSGVAGQLRGDDFREGAANADLALRRGGYLADLGDREFSQGARLRDEARTERGTQRDFYDRDVSNRYGYIDRLSDIGFRPPNLGPLQGAAAAEAGQADRAYQGAGNLIGSVADYYARRRTPPMTTSGTPTTVGTTYPMPTRA